MSPAAGKIKALRPARRSNAYEAVAETIRQQVCEGTLKEGERLPPERNLARQFGVSRAVVREAIRSLELAGMLRVKAGAGGGTFVSHEFQRPLATSLSNLLDGGAISLDDLFELRLLLEPPVVLRAAQSKPRRLAELGEVVARAEEAADDPAALRELNLEFHRRLVGLADNPLLSALFETVLELLVRRVRGRLNHDISQTVLVWHRRILAALQKGDGEKARSLLKSDLGELQDRYKRLVAKESSGRKSAGREAKSKNENPNQGREA